MSKYKVKVGKGELTLRKSEDLVGLKSVKSEKRDAAPPPDFIKEEKMHSLGGFRVVTLENGDGPLDERLDEVRQKEEVEVGTHVYFAEGDKNPMVPTGEIFILFQPDVDVEEQALVLDEFRLELVERRGEDEVIARVTKESRNPVKTASLLMQVSMVKMAEPDMDMLLQEYDLTIPNDTYMSEGWHLKNDGKIDIANYHTLAGADAKVVNAWQRLGNLGSSKVVISIIDNGLDVGHPDLKNKVYRPFDLWTNSDRLTMGDPTFTHGTPCASLAVGSANGSGMVGVAPNAKFMPISGTSYSTRATERMFEYAVQNGADIISCSWGTTNHSYQLNSLKERAIAKAAQEGRNGKGSVILFAAGNEGLDYVNFYAAHPDVICVAASDSKDRYARYSNQGMEVSVCAPSNGDWPLLAARASWDPGTTIRGDGAWKYFADGKWRDGLYKHFGGTSGATPIVAGVCALMLSANPNLTAREVKEILQSTADKIGPPSEYVNGHSRKFGFGRVNADKAVAEAMRRKDGTSGTVTPPPTPVEENVSGGEGLFRFTVERQEPRGWGVQMGVFAEYGNVLINAEKLQKQFAETIVVNINELNGKTVYKVIVGAFPSKSDAVSLRKEMKEKGVDGFLKNLEGFA